LSSIVSEVAAELKDALLPQSISRDYPSTQENTLARMLRFQLPQGFLSIIMIILVSKTIENEL